MNNGLEMQNSAVPRENLFITVKAYIQQETSGNSLKFSKRICNKAVLSNLHFEIVILYYIDTKRIVFFIFLMGGE